MSERPVHTDALDTLGSIISPAESRDAIHLAVENGVAGQNLFPGDDVGFLDDGTFGLVENPVGIVDPFLKNEVKPGEHFWVVVYPRQVTSLRHVWTHPAFDRPDSAIRITDPKSCSQLWLEDYADELDVSYADLMENAAHYLSHGDYWNMGEKFDSVDFNYDFWDHYQAMTGDKVDENDRNSFLTCSC